MEYDRSRTATLEECGIAVLRFTNRDIDDNFEGVCQVIEQEIKERAEQSLLPYWDTDSLNLTSFSIDGILIESRGSLIYQITDMEKDSP